MTDSSEYAVRTLQEAEQAGGQLKEIDQAVGKIRDMNGRIAAAAQSQRDEAQDLGSALQEIAVLAGEAIEVSRDNERMGVPCANSPTNWERWWDGSGSPEPCGPIGCLAVGPGYAKAAPPGSGQRGLLHSEVQETIQLLGLVQQQ